MTSGWQTKRLAEACIIQPSKSEAKQKLSGSDLVSFVPMDSLGIGQKQLNASQVRPLDEVVGSYTYFAEGDVLLAKITPCFENGKLGIAQNLKNGVGFGSSEYIVFRGCDGLNNQFLYYYLSRETFREEGAKRMTGAVGHKRVAKDFIENSVIPLPPIPEQQRIVTILDQAFEGIATATATAEKNLANARELYESHLQSIFTRKGDGWVDKPFGAVCGFVRGPFGGSLKKSIFVAEGFAIYEQQHAIYNQFSEVRYFVNEAKFNEMKRFELRPNDLIMSCSGTMGCVAIVPEGIKRGIINQALLKLSPSKMVNSAFLKAWMDSKAFQDALKEYSGGAAIQNVASVKILKEIKVPLPPLSEQQNIIDRLDEFSTETQHLEAIYQQKLVALDELKKSILNQAFSGQLH